MPWKFLPACIIPEAQGAIYNISAKPLCLTSLATISKAPRPPVCQHPVHRLEEAMGKWSGCSLSNFFKDLFILNL